MAAVRVDQRSIRRANLSTVLRRVAADGPRSRATIALETGFTKTTVSSLVAVLIDAGLLVEVDDEDVGPRSVGRPARPVGLNGRAIAAAGLEVNVDYLAVCVTDLSGEVRFQARVEADHAHTRPGPILTRLARLGRKAIERVEGEGARVVGAALGVPGLVDLPGDALVLAPNLGWHDVHAADELRRRLRRPGLPIRIDNEANLAALAEHWEGAAQDLETFVCVSGDVGIGAGVLVRGELFRGAHGFGGELGHVMTDPDGRPCACGSRGCLETIAGQAAVLEAAGIAVEDEHPGLAAEELLRRLEAGEPRALAAVEAAGRALGVALAGVVNLLDPEAVLLGGYLGPFTPWIGGPVREELSQRVLAARVQACEVRPAALAHDAATRGGAASVLRAVLADPLLALA